MKISFNQRLFKIYESLKERGEIDSYVRFGEIIGENKAGVNDLKSGRKKASLEHCSSLKKTYPELNSDYVLVSEGEIFHSSDKNILSKSVAESDPNYPSANYKTVIKALRETIDSQKETIQALKT